MRTRRALIAVSILAPALALARWATGRIRLEDTLTTDVAIPFGEAGGRELLLDVYSLPQRERPRPAVLLIHGGGFVSGSRTDADIVAAARHLAQAGYVAFAIDYRLVDLTQPGPAWPAPLDDVQRAVRWVRAHAPTYGVDPERIGAYGISAGAGLAAHLGVRESPSRPIDDLAAFSSRVRCVVALAGPMDGTIPSGNPGDIDVAQAFSAGWSRRSLTSTATPRPWPTLILSPPLSWSSMGYRHGGPHCARAAAGGGPAGGWDRGGLRRVSRCRPRRLRLGAGWGADLGLPRPLPRT